MPTAHCILVDPSQRRVWVAFGDKGWKLPALEWNVPENTDPCINVHYLNQALETQWGLEGTILYGFHSRDDDANEVLWIFAVEIRGAPPSVAGGWRILDDLDETAPDRAFFRPLLAAFFAEAVDGGGPVEPWCATGFAAEAEAWIRTQFSAPVGIYQYKQWYRGAVWRVECGGERYYFKACPQHLRQEIAVAELLANRLPQRVAPIVALDKQRGWLLSRDSGGRSLAECADIAVWEEGLRAYARLQRDGIDLVEDIGDAVPDWSLPTMAGAFPDLLHDMGRLMDGSPDGLAADELAALHRRIPQVQTLCQQAADCGVPHALEHCDIYSSDNLHRTERGFVFFDWAEACITHPFTGCMYFLMVDGRFPGAGAAERFRDVYLEMWTDYATLGELHRLMDLMPALRQLQEALHYAQQIERLLDRIPAPARRPYSYAAWTIEQAQSWLPHFLRLLAAALQKLETD